MQAIHSTALLNGATVHAEWRDGELWITWRRFGETLAGLVLSREHAAQLAETLHAASLDASLFEKEQQ